METNNDESADRQQPTPVRRLRLDGGDLLTFAILIGMSAWLWSHATPTLGSGAPFVGGAIGLAIAFLVREFC